LAERLGLLSEQERRAAEERLRCEERIRDYAVSTSIGPSLANPILQRTSSSSIREPVRLAELARRPEVSLGELLEVTGMHVPSERWEWADIEFKYSGYLAKERATAERLARMDEFPLPPKLEYQDLTELSFEARQKLSALRPASLGQARRIPGVSPSDIQSLVGAVLRNQRKDLVSRET
jgi:tRNA uridine 5-carboxymethylaminomethyl modification enzyme